MSERSSAGDEDAIRRLIEGWAIWRDTGDFERLLGAYHSGGRMVTTWFEGPAEEFVAHSKAAFARGSTSHHVLGGTFVRLAGNRAIAQTRLVLCARGKLEGCDYDATCWGRFYDFLDYREGRWGIALRQPTYEKDRLDPVDPRRTVAFDSDLLASFPEGYRHLAYLQTQNGQSVAKGLPGLRGPEIERLYARGEAWLRGAAAP